MSFPNKVVLIKSINVNNIGKVVSRCYTSVKDTVDHLNTEKLMIYFINQPPKLSERINSF